MRRVKIKPGRGLLISAVTLLAMIGCKKSDVNISDAGVDTESNVAVNLATASSTCAPIPADLQVSSGNRLAIQAYARGVQIYEVKRSTIDNNVFVWVNTAPSATLYAKPDFTNPVGNHYAGPSWEFTKGLYKGEKVVGLREKAVPVDATAIPWLLLKAVDSLSSPGNKITYIQRICTTGGLAPSNVPIEADLGRVEKVPYTAGYLFYTVEM